jgi:hypothetical protein
LEVPDVKESVPVVPEEVQAIQEVNLEELPKLKRKKKSKTETEKPLVSVPTTEGRKKKQ